MRLEEEQPSKGQVDWSSDGGWARPQLKPISDLRIHPASQVLQQGLGVREELRAVRGDDGELRLFRADKAVERLLDSVQRLELPVGPPPLPATQQTFDGAELIDLARLLLAVEADWAPSQKTSPGAALSIQPNLIGCSVGHLT